MNNRLSLEESSTIAAYEEIERNRSERGYYNPDFWIDQFKTLQKLQTSGRILDIGCGNGVAAHLFLDNGYEYVGIDMSETSLEKARANVVGGDFRIGNMLELDFADNSFDGFWSTVTLLHTSKNKVDIALREIKRVVKNGGAGFISMQRGEGERMVPAPDAPGQARFFSFYSLDEFADKLTESGFEVIEKEAPVDVSGANPKSGDGWLLYFVRVNK